MRYDGVVSTRVLLVFLALGMTGCSARKSASKTAADAPPSSACGRDCGPMDACIEGVCRKNPFMHGAARPDAVEATASAVCPYASSEIPPVDDIPDAGVPEYDAARTRVVDMQGKNERLSDEVLDGHLEAIHPRLMECIDLGACYADDPLFGGTFDFQLRVAGSGAVTEASVTTSPQLQLEPIVACARRSVAEVRFPPFEGTMSVTYSVVID
jgi:hypothetical protein